MIAILIESSIRAALVAAAVGLVLLMLRVRDSSVRHAAWTAVVIAMLTMPALPAWLPAIPVPVPDVVLLDASSWTPFQDEVNSIVTVPTAPAAAVPLATPSDEPRTRSASTTRAPSRSWSWAGLALTAWMVGVLTFLLRVAVGWRSAVRLARSSRSIAAERVPCASRLTLYESEHLATPVTVGVFSPRIILPVAWTTWPAGKLRAVLAHEEAHVARHDTLTSLIARVNRCVFWFHPLAWWLERRLIVTAEQACDDQVVRATGDAQPYAQVLVEMSEAVRRFGGRVAWLSVGIGSGRIEPRIDRVLRGDVWTTVSRTRKTAVAIACATVIALGIACQQPVAELQPDPEVAERLARQKANSDEYKAAIGMTRDQVAALEAVVAANPDDLETTRKLLAFYRESGQTVLGWNEMVAARRPHLLRLIERHPESDLTYWPMKRSLDPVGYDQARALWLAHVEKPGVTSKMLGAAAAFFRISEKPFAEQLLLRALAIDPDGPQPRRADGIYYAPWISRLGALYAQAIVGSDDETIFNVVKSISLDEARGSYAASVRKKLETSSDAKLLIAAGRYLINNASQVEGKIGFDHIGLGRSYLERALQLDPKADARRWLDMLKERDEYRGDHGKLPHPSDEAAVAAMPELERLAWLPSIASGAFGEAERAEYYKHDQAGFEASLERARRYAEQSLDLAAKHPGDPHSEDALYRSHITLGLVAVRRNDRPSAVKHMRLAVQRPRSFTIDENTDGARPKLVNYLLKAGERESVASFLEQASGFVSDPAPLKRDAKAIREGRMPLSYQYMVTRQ